MNRKGIITAITIALATIAANAQVDLNKVLNDAANKAGVNTGSSAAKGLSNDKIIAGLKEALSVGTKNAGATASKLDGYYKNPLIKIPFPKEARDVEKMARQFGMSKQAEKFVQSMNRAAEDAAKKAAPIFLDAITGMTINDGLSILQGGDNAATSYLKTSTQTKLKAEFSPIVKQSLAKAQVTKYWTDVAKVYNKVPYEKKVNPKLDEYVTQKAIDGLFTLVGQEEAKIRKDPAAQVTNLLQEVFGGK